MNEELIDKIKRSFFYDKDFKKYPDFITDIHFPCFKGLKANAEIKFQFPLTAIVGENGCGKSSVLQALENAPEGNSYSQKWFSTSVDPIPEEPRPAFWYSYNSVEAQLNVQILNQRIKKEKNPDYWEPSRPVAKYGMAKFEESETPINGALKTRWKGTKRKVLYLDFRGELSAFDKYFYFGEKPSTRQMHSKQDYIRHYAKYLKAIIEGKIKAGFKFQKKKKVNAVIKLSSDETSVISSILDKKYNEITIMSHGFYKQFGDSVYFKLDKVKTETFDGNYTEAFAGSGESAVVKLVHQIHQADYGTLVLLDEPEVSLHPSAQKQLLFYLLKQTFEKGLQIVLTTHSPSIVEELPKEAIVLLRKDVDGTFIPRCSVEPELAFQYIGHTQIHKKRILVEDKSAKELLTACLELYDEKAIDSIDITYHTGGAEDILIEAATFALFNETKTFIMLDGDKRREDFPDDKDIASSDIDDTIKKCTGINTDCIRFPADSGEGKEKQIEQEKRNYIAYLKKHLYYFQTNDPEEIMWKASSLKKPRYNDSDYKVRIKKWVESEVGPRFKAQDIETYQKRLCNKLKKDNEYVKGILKILTTVLDQK